MIVGVSASGSKILIKKLVLVSLTTGLNLSEVENIVAPV
jgi:hypothetical protein